MAILPIPGEPSSRVNFARANEVQFIGGEAGNPCKMRGKTPSLHFDIYLVQMENLLEQLKNIKFDKNDWRAYPILLRWIESGSMKAEVDVISKKADYLAGVGAKSKVKEWLSSDIALTHITAERYLLDNIRKKNANFLESFTGGGVDGYLKIHDDNIGIEVTTVNHSLPEWILRERLLSYLSVNTYNRGEGVEISYDLSKLEGIKYENLEIIPKIGSMIMRGNFHEIDGITVKKISREGSYISWNILESGNNFFANIRDSLTRILTDKSKQLNKNAQNILFVCVDQLPYSIYNPGIFRELSGHVYHQDWIDELEKIVKETLTDNVLGVCFFVYTLSSEEMMYPLRVLWKDDKKQIPIIL